jgi:hypothetical protein
VNAPFYFGRNPSGFGLANLGPAPDLTALSESERLGSREVRPGLVFTAADAKGATIRRVGADEPAVSRPPREGDYIFLRPTEYNPAAIGAWGIIPNVQFFWLVDAVSQNQKIPASHVGLVALYGLAQIGAFLALGVALFQKREVG